MASPAFNLNAMMPMVQALQDRYGQAMDIQTQRMSDAGTNDRIAFDNWRKKQALEQERAKQGMAMERKAYSSAEASKALALREKRDAAAIATNKERAGLNAQMMRHYPGMDAGGNRPGLGGLADYYQYGTGSAAGRGGGADAKGAPENATGSGAPQLPAEAQNCPPGMRFDGKGCSYPQPYGLG